MLLPTPPPIVLASTVVGIVLVASPPMMLGVTVAPVSEPSVPGETRRPVVLFTLTVTATLSVVPRKFVAAEVPPLGQCPGICVGFCGANPGAAVPTRDLVGGAVGAEAYALGALWAGGAVCAVSTRRALCTVCAVCAIGAREGLVRRLCRLCHRRREGLVHRLCRLCRQHREGLVGRPAPSVPSAPAGPCAPSVPAPCRPCGPSGAFEAGSARRANGADRANGPAGLARRLHHRPGSTRRAGRPCGRCYAPTVPS